MSLFSNTNHIMLTHKIAKENVVMKRKAYVSANQSFLTTIVNSSKQTTSAAQLVSNFLCVSLLSLFCCKQTHNACCLLLWDWILMVEEMLRIFFLTII